MPESNWSQAVRTLEHDLVCPSCGEQNTPHAVANKIHVDDRGEASCDACGKGGPIQIFQRKG